MSDALGHTVYNFLGKKLSPESKHTVHVIHTEGRRFSHKECVVLIIGAVVTVSRGTFQSWVNEGSIFSYSLFDFNFEEIFFQRSKKIFCGCIYES